LLLPPMPEMLILKHPFPGNAQLRDWRLKSSFSLNNESSRLFSKDSPTVITVLVARYGDS
jgi:hypothetical protein